jgi:hypothetical protein
VKRPSGWINSAFKEYAFQVSVDEGITWANVHTGTGENQDCCDFQTITFDDNPTIGKYFRLYMHNNWDYGHFTISYMEFLIKGN